MHPLDGPYLKLLRAKQHLKAIQTLAEWLKKNHPYRIVQGVVGEGHAREHVVRIEQTGELTPDLSLLVGDFCNELRSALDHLLWQLWLLQYPTFSEKVYFPICDCVTQFRSNAPRNIGPRKIAGMVSSLTDNQIANIEGLQPYRTGNPILSILRDVNDHDKHRLIQVIVVAPRGYKIVVTFDQSSALIQIPKPKQIPVTVYRGTKIESGTIFARFPLNSISEGTKVNVRSEIISDFAFEGSKSADGKLVKNTLNAMFIEVRRIINLFEPEFASFGVSKFK